MKNNKAKLLIVMLLTAFLFPISSIESNSLQVPPCPGGGTLCSKIRVLCSGYMCHDAGEVCSVGEAWPIQVNFGEDGIWTVTCFEGAIVEG